MTLRGRREGPPTEWISLHSSFGAVVSLHRDCFRYIESARAFVNHPGLWETAWASPRGILRAAVTKSWSDAWGTAGFWCFCYCWFQLGSFIFPLQPCAGCPSAMLRPFPTSPGDSESHSTPARTECNESSGGVTKLSPRSKNVTKCNENTSRLDPELPFIAFRYILAPEQYFRYTAAVFVTFRPLGCCEAFRITRACRKWPGHRRGAACERL